MEGDAFPSFWPNNICAVRSDSSIDVVVSNMETLHTLLKAL